MQTDLYTKAVFTVSPLALSAITLQRSTASTFGQNKKEPVKIIVCDPIYWEVNCAEVSYGAIKVGR
jgi:hypothetical protein